MLGFMETISNWVKTKMIEDKNVCLEILENVSTPQDILISFTYFYDYEKNRKTIFKNFERSVFESTLLLNISIEKSKKMILT